MMMKRKMVSLWYDPEVDILEVIWEKGAGTFESIEADDRILERVDDEGNALGFMIHEFSTVKADSWIDFEIGGKPRTGIENMTADMAAKEMGISHSRMRQL